MTERPRSDSRRDTARAIEELLVCPTSRGPLKVNNGAITCPQSGFKGSLLDDVAIMSPSIPKTFFDDKFKRMQTGHLQNSGEQELCYTRQRNYLSKLLAPGQVILDVGCGPSLPYTPPRGAFVIGLEPSFHSIRENKDVDLRVSGTATSIPMRDSSVDIIVCFYSIHHMVSDTIAMTRATVADAFREFARVLKPSGNLFVFEMTPIPPFLVVQSLFWNLLRRSFPGALDMYFWSQKALQTMAARQLPNRSGLEIVTFRSSMFAPIPPIFNLSWFKVPRLIYPLGARLYRWTFPGQG